MTPSTIQFQFFFQKINFFYWIPIVCPAWYIFIRISGNNVICVPVTKKVAFNWWEAKASNTTNEDGEGPSSYEIPHEWGIVQFVISFVQLVATYLSFCECFFSFKGMSYDFQ